MFYVDTRKKYKIVADSLSGMWVKWIPGQFKDSQKWGRYAFIDNPFRRNSAAKEKIKRVMTEWILAFFPDECMPVPSAVSTQSGSVSGLPPEENPSAETRSDRTIESFGASVS